MKWSLWWMTFPSPCLWKTAVWQIQRAVIFMLEGKLTLSASIILGPPPFELLLHVLLMLHFNIQICKGDSGIWMISSLSCHYIFWSKRHTLIPFSAVTKQKIILRIWIRVKPGRHVCHLINMSCASRHWPPFS